MVTRIDVHLQSEVVSVYWLWLLLYASALSVVIVVIAICDMPRQELSLCERVYVQNTMFTFKGCPVRIRTSTTVYEKLKIMFWNTTQISSKVSRWICA